MYRRIPIAIVIVTTLVWLVAACAPVGGSSVGFADSSSCRVVINGSCRNP